MNTPENPSINSRQVIFSSVGCKLIGKLYSTIYMHIMFFALFCIHKSNSFLLYTAREYEAVSALQTYRTEV